MTERTQSKWRLAEKFEAQHSALLAKHGRLAAELSAVTQEIAQLISDTPKEVLELCKVERPK